MSIAKKGLKRNILTKEHKEKIALSLKGRARSDEIKEKISKTKLKNPQVFDEKRRSLCIINATGNKSHCKKVKVTSKDWVKKYDSVLSTAKDLGYTRGYLSRFLNKKEKHSKYVFEYI